MEPTMGREWKVGDEAVSDGGEVVTLLRREPRPDAGWIWLVRLAHPGDAASDHVPFRVAEQNLRPVSPAPSETPSPEVGMPRSCELCGATADLISVCDDADECLRRMIAPAKEPSK